MTRSEETSAVERAGRQQRLGERGPAQTEQRASVALRDIAGRRIIAEGLERNVWNDLYFNAMTVSWPTFVAALAAAFVALNFIFALIYDLGDAPIANAREGSLADLFFFSVETTSTVGYGDMHPQTIYGHVVATAENFIGLLLLAVMTGLVFARFSRPRARILFARYPVVDQAQRRDDADFPHGQRAQQLHHRGDRQDVGARPDRDRGGQAAGRLRADAAAQVGEPDLRAELDAVSSDRRPKSLVREGRRDAGRERDELCRQHRRLRRTSGQTVHARDVFAAQDVRFGHEYVDIIWIDEQGMRHIDYAKIDATRPVSPNAGAADDKPALNSEMEPAAGAGEVTEDERR